MSNFTKTSTLTLEKFYCNKAQKDNCNDTDEVYMKVIPDDETSRSFKYPAQKTHSMGTGDTWTLDVPINFSQYVDVNFYEADSSSSDDTIGKQRITLETTSPIKYDNNCDFDLYFSIS